MRQRRCNLIQRIAETRIDVRAIEAKGHFRRHIEDEIVAIANNVDARARGLLTQLSFLFVHIIANACTGQCANTCADNFFGAIAAAANKVAKQISTQCAANATQCRLRNRALAGFRIGHTCR